ncbi:MAG: hypothetical protein AAF720_09110 [Pseudomonadota bacterium]
MGELIGFLPFLFFIAFILLQGARRRQQSADLVRAFTRLQRKRKSRIITVVHRQESMGFLGIPIFRYIDLNDAEDMLEAIRTTPPKQPLEIILHTPGGLVLPALQIARAVKAHPGPTRVYVPHYAMSGGTLIALAADEIILNEHAVLGPIDPQIGGLPAASIVRVTQTKSPDAVEDRTMVLADIGQMAINQLERAARELLSGTVSDNAAIAAAEQLSSGRWTHDYPIEAAEAREIGLNTSTDMPKDINALMALFPDRMSRQSVKFIDQVAGIWPFNRKKKTPEPMGIMPAIGERMPFTGFEPGPGSRSFSYGPWDPKDLRAQLSPGPSPEDVRRHRER